MIIDILNSPGIESVELSHVEASSFCCFIQQFMVFSHPDFIQKNQIKVLRLSFNDARQGHQSLTFVFTYKWEAPNVER